MDTETGEIPVPRRQAALRRRAAACERLKSNVLRQGYLPRDGGPARATIGGQTVFLPAYIPYVGLEYFAHRPRILCYAINQNLSRHRRWTGDWTAEWARDDQAGVDRLNHAALAGKAIPIKPYAEGFIPLVAAMAFAAEQQAGPGAARPLIDDAIAVTNFVKFSTAEDASSSSIPASWWKQCARRYVGEEIEALQPDVVIAFGQRTARELGRVLDTMNGRNGTPKLLPCRFPGRIPSSKARPLSFEESRMWTKCILPLADRLKRSPADSYHTWRMLRFPGYFCDVADSWGIFSDREVV